MLRYLIKQIRHKQKYKTNFGALPCDPTCGGFDQQQIRHKQKYKTNFGALPCDPTCGGFDQQLL